MKYFFIVFIISLFISFQSSAQRRVINELQRGGLYWTRYYLEWKVSDKIAIDTELENRRFFSVNRQYQTVARISLYYLKSDSFNFGGGIAYSGLYSLFTDLIQSEIRPHQEVNIKHRAGRWDFNHRLRLEERFRQDTIRTFLSPEEVEEIKLSSYSFDLRTRYEISSDFAMLRKNRKKGHWDLQLASEIMVNDSLDEFFNTLRLYAGVRYFLTDKITLDFGYLKSIEIEYAFDLLYNYDNLRFTFRQRI